MRLDHRAQAERALAAHEQLGQASCAVAQRVDLAIELAALALCELALELARRDREPERSALFQHES
jgi:hypothetical protein